MQYSLIANSGIQMFTFKLKLNLQDKFKMWFHEWYDTSNGQWRLDLERFSSLGVIEDVSKRPLSELDSFFDELESLFAFPDCHKSDIVTALKRFLPNFEHVEKGKNLDQKM